MSRGDRTPAVSDLCSSSGIGHVIGLRACALGPVTCPQLSLSWAPSSLVGSFDTPSDDDPDNSPLTELPGTLACRSPPHRY